MKQIYKLGISAALVASLYAPLAAQNGTRLLGLDAATIGRGGTVTGNFDNPSLIQNNPAGLAFLESPQLDVSFSLMTPKLTFQNSVNDASGKNKIFPVGSIGYAGKAKNEKIAYGIGVYTQGGLGSEYSLNHTLFRDPSGNFIPQKYHSQFAVIQGGGSFAYKIIDQLSIGVTANVVYSQFSFGQPFSISPGFLQGVIDPSTGFTFGQLFSGSPQQGGLGYDELVAGADISGLNAFQFNGKIGLAYKPNDKLSVGLNYTLPTKLNYKGGKASLDMNTQFNDAFGRVVQGILTQDPSLTPEQAQQAAATQFGQLGIDLSQGAADEYEAKATLSLPQSLAVGVAYAFNPKLRISTDLEWINWSNAFKTLDIQLAEGKNPNVNKLIGTNGSLDIPFPLQWKDSWVVRVGVEYDPIDLLTLRAGYIYGNNPVAPNTLFPVFPAIVKHHLTLGTAVNVSESIAINLAYEHAFKNTEKADAISLVGSQYNNSVSSLQNHLFHASLSWKFN